MRDRLVAAVLRGEKTAAGSLLAEWEADREPLPRLPAPLAQPLTDDTRIVVERFRLVTEA
jgi:uncharacterized protein YhfF